MLANNALNFDIRSFAKRPDLAFAFGIVIIMVLLIMPMPSMLMDMCLAISITFSILILMTSLFIERPLDFSTFPTVLLVATMIRLSLNVASTRLILSHGHEGTKAAGKVIEAFGNFVMGGNFVIGLIVFAILIIVNFVVITKGSGRIAEVSARFSLDAMPGKQMAIDADLSAGLVNEETARKRRKDLENESNFFGSMDGAAKFVRGDAIAGLLITFINIIGGIVIGMLQNNMSFLDASRTYIILTVGDGLVTQIPALIVSTAAGMLVSKSGVDGSADKALFRQLSAYPAALGMASFLMGTMSLLPSMPFLPFMLLSALSGWGAWNANKKQIEQQKIQEEASQIDDLQMQATAVQDISTAEKDIATPIDPIRLELGYGLLNLLNDEKGNRLAEQIKSLRQQLSKEFGIILPSVRIQDNLNLSQNSYVIKIKELEAGSGELRMGSLLVMDPKNNPIDLNGESILEPTFNLPAMWISEDLYLEAESRGYTIVKPAVVLTTHLTEIVKDNISDLLTYSDVQSLLENLTESYKKLVNDIVPSSISVGGIQRILQSLINERVSVRDLNTILEGIAEACSFTRNIVLIIEHVRMRLYRQITYSNLDHNGILPIITLSPFLEKLIADHLEGESDVKQLVLPPQQLSDIINKVNNTLDKMMLFGESPVLIVNNYIRPYVRSFLERSRPSTVVMSQNEIYPKVKIKNLEQID
jgi:flagellar biosynthesis protein FlhA